MSLGPPRTRILLVEDNPGDAELVRSMLSKATIGKFEVETVVRLAEAVARAAAGDIDVLVLDLSLPDSSGIETLIAMRDAAPITPIVVLTGEGNERGGLEAVNRGAQDYLVKGDIDGSGVARSLLYAVERRRFQEERSRQEDLLAETEQLAGLGSFDWDFETDQVAWSDELYRIYGVDRRSFTPKRTSLLETAHAEDRGRVEAILERARGSNEPFDFEFRTVPSRGGIAVLHARGRIHLDAAGVPKRMAGTCQDVTERKKLEEALLFSSRMSSIGTLAAGVAHEINNPLCFVMANLNFIADATEAEPGTEPSREQLDLRSAIEDSREGADRIRKIVRGLKAFSRADEERRVAIELGPMVDLSINMTFNEIRFRAKLVKDFQPTPRVLADEARLSQVFVNLLVNAAHAVGEDRPAEANEIRVSTCTDASGNAVVEVHDTGPGIPESDRARIFDPFFTTKPVGVGTGLGLSICAGIVSSHGGAISVETGKDTGTTFRVVLPAAPPGDAAIETSTDTKSPPGRRARALVIDDEPLVAAAIRRILAAEHDVTTARSGVEALERFEKGERFDVILSDLMMPVMNGVELYERLAVDYPDQAAKMIFVTGGAFTATTQSFLDRVTNKRIDKPFHPAQVLSLVRSVVA